MEQETSTGRVPLVMANYAIEICIYTGLWAGEAAALRRDCITDGELLSRKSECRIDHEDSAVTYESGATKNGKEQRTTIQKSSIG